MEDKLLNAKRELLSILILLDETEISDNECDIMYSLSKDEQIQKLFEKNKRNKF